MEKAQSNSGQAKWTFLVYMAGDNNLDGAALRDIAEMAKAGSTKDVNILVQLDRIEDQKTQRFRISVPPEVMLEYVVATIDVKEQKLKLFLDKKQVEEFDYKLR